MELLTIAEIARRLHMPESTVRYYRDRFGTFFPEVGEGRTRRYRPEVLEVVSFIADMLRSGVPADEVESALQGHFAMTLEPQQQSSAPQQQSSAIMNQMLAELLRSFAEEQNKAVMTELEQLRNEVAASREDNARMLDRMEERDKSLMETLRTLQESKKKKGLFKRLFD